MSARYGSKILSEKAEVWKNRISEYRNSATVDKYEQNKNTEIDKRKAHLVRTVQNSAKTLSTKIDEHKMAISSAENALSKAEFNPQQRYTTSSKKISTTVQAKRPQASRIPPPPTKQNMNFVQEKQQVCHSSSEMPVRSSDGDQNKSIEFNTVQKSHLDSENHINQFKASESVSETGEDDVTFNIPTVIENESVLSVTAQSELSNQNIQMVTNSSEQQENLPNIHKFDPESFDENDFEHDNDMATLQSDLNILKDNMNDNCERLRQDSGNKESRNEMEDTIPNKDEDVAESNQCSHFSKNSNLNSVSDESIHQYLVNKAGLSPRTVERALVAAKTIAAECVVEYNLQQKMHLQNQDFHQVLDSESNAEYQQLNIHNMIFYPEGVSNSTTPKDLKRKTQSSDEVTNNFSWQRTGPGPSQSLSLSDNQQNAFKKFNRSSTVSSLTQGSNKLKTTGLSDVSKSITIGENNNIKRMHQSRSSLNRASSTDTTLGTLTAQTDKIGLIGTMDSSQHYLNSPSREKQNDLQIKQAINTSAIPGPGQGQGSNKSSESKIAKKSPVSPTLSEKSQKSTKSQSQQPDKATARSGSVILGGTISNSQNIGLNQFKNQKTSKASKVQESMNLNPSRIDQDSDSTAHKSTIIYNGPQMKIGPNITSHMAEKYNAINKATSIEYNLNQRRKTLDAKRKQLDALLKEIDNEGEKLAEQEKELGFSPTDKETGTMEQIKKLRKSMAEIMARFSESDDHVDLINLEGTELPSQSFSPLLSGLDFSNANGRGINDNIKEKITSDAMYQPTISLDIRSNYSQSISPKGSPNRSQNNIEFSPRNVKSSTLFHMYDKRTENFKSHADDVTKSFIDGSQKRIDQIKSTPYIGLGKNCISADKAVKALSEPFKVDLSIRSVPHPLPSSFETLPFPFNSQLPQKIIPQNGMSNSNLINYQNLGNQTQSQCPSPMYPSTIIQPPKLDQIRNLTIGHTKNSNSSHLMIPVQYYKNLQSPITEIVSPQVVAEMKKQHPKVQLPGWNTNIAPKISSIVPPKFIAGIANRFRVQRRGSVEDLEEILLESDNIDNSSAQQYGQNQDSSSSRILQSPQRIRLEPRSVSASGRFPRKGYKTEIKFERKSFTNQPVVKMPISTLRPLPKQVMGGNSNSNVKKQVSLRDLHRYSSRTNFNTLNNSTVPISVQKSSTEVRRTTSIKRMTGNGQIVEVSKSQTVNPKAMSSYTLYYSEKR